VDIRKVVEKVDKATKGVQVLGVALSGLFFAVLTIRNFVIQERLYSPDRIQNLVGLNTSKTDTIRAILESLKTNTKSDRVFLLFYGKNKFGKDVGTITTEYQVQNEFLSPIPPGNYEISIGLDYRRYQEHQSSNCTKYEIEKLDQKDSLVKKLVDAGTQYHYSCPFTLTLKKQGVLAIVGVEYTTTPNIDGQSGKVFLSEVEGELRVVSADIAQVFDPK
jgi:hypothetical protein